MNAWMINIILVDFNEDVSILNLFFLQGIPYLLAMISMIPLGLGIKDASLTYLIVQTGVQPQPALVCYSNAYFYIGIFNYCWFFFNQLFDEEKHF